MLWVAHAPTNGTGALHRVLNVTGLHAGVSFKGSTCYPQASNCSIEVVAVDSEMDSTKANSVNFRMSVDLQPNSVVAMFFQ